MKAILGRKVGMSQLFTPTGEVVAVTIVSAEPNDVTIRRLPERDGYSATQLALPKKAGVAGEYAARREFNVEVGDDVKVLTVSQFEPGDVVEVSGTSKGKGFQGVVKRHHFKGGPASHGHRHVLRRPGSIGGRFPQHVMKGLRMAGHMGDERVTVKNLVVAAVDTDKNLLAIRGAVPGKRGSIVEVRLAMGA